MLPCNAMLCNVLLCTDYEMVQQLQPQQPGLQGKIADVRKQAQRRAEIEAQVEALRQQQQQHSQAQQDKGKGARRRRRRRRGQTGGSVGDDDDEEEGGEAPATPQQGEASLKTASAEQWSEEAFKRLFDKTGARAPLPPVRPAFTSPESLPRPRGVPTSDEDTGASGGDSPEVPAGPPPASVQLSLIQTLQRQYNTRGICEGDLWYLVSDAWVREWKELLAQGVEDMTLRPVDNEPLLLAPVPKGQGAVSLGGLLRHDISIDNDCHMVGEEMWKALVTWYGGGPPLPRVVRRVAEEEGEEGILVLDFFPVSSQQPRGSSSNVFVVT